MKEPMMIESVVDVAVANGLGGQSCSEAIASAFGPWLGCDSPVQDMACGFAGGMGLRGETCGVVAAALLIIGAKVGMLEEDSRVKRASIMRLSAEYAESFAEENGSTLCDVLCHGADLRTPEGARALRESGKPEHLIRSGARLLACILLRESEVRKGQVPSDT